MPISNYLAFHEEARMTQTEKETLISWFEKELESMPSKNSNNNI